MLDDIQSLAPSSSRDSHPNECEVRQKSQEDSMDEERGPKQIQTKKEEYKSSGVRARLGDLGGMQEHFSSNQE